MVVCNERNGTERNRICCMCGSAHITKYHWATLIQCFPLRYIPYNTQCVCWLVSWCLYFFSLHVYLLSSRFLFVCTSTNSNMVFVEHGLSSVTHQTPIFFFFSSYKQPAKWQSGERKKQNQFHIGNCAIHTHTNLGVVHGLGEQQQQQQKIGRKKKKFELAKNVFTRFHFLKCVLVFTPFYMHCTHTHMHTTNSLMRRADTHFFHS